MVSCFVSLRRSDCARICCQLLTRSSECWGGGVRAPGSYNAWTCVKLQILSIRKVDRIMKGRNCAWTSTGASNCPDLWRIATVLCRFGQLNSVRQFMIFFAYFLLHYFVSLRTHKLEKTFLVVVDTCSREEIHDYCRLMGVNDYRIFVVASGSLLSFECITRSRFGRGPGIGDCG